MNRIYMSLLAVFLVTAGISERALSQDSMALANAVVTAADRSPEDRALDAGRKPAQLLAFLGVQPGWRIADLGAGGGYTTELLQRAVGSEGVVYGQNSKKLLEMFLEKPWSARLAKPVMKGVVRMDRDFDLSRRLASARRGHDGAVLSRHGLARGESRGHEQGRVRCAQAGRCVCDCRSQRAAGGRYRCGQYVSSN